MVGHKRNSDRQGAYLAAGLAGFALGVAPSQILETERGSLEVSRARQVAMYLAHVGFGMSLARVAEAFGRDRSTVAYACHAIEDRREDERFDAWMETLEQGVIAVAPLQDVLVA